MPAHRKRKRYEVTVRGKDGECISDAIVLGESGLADELDHLPIHSNIKVTRLTDWEDNSTNG